MARVSAPDIVTITTSPVLSTPRCWANPQGHRRAKARRRKSILSGRRNISLFFKENNLLNLESFLWPNELFTRKKEERKMDTFVKAKASEL